MVWNITWFPLCLFDKNNIMMKSRKATLKLFLFVKFCDTVYKCNITKVTLSLWRKKADFIFNFVGKMCIMYGYVILTLPDTPFICQWELLHLLLLWPMSDLNFFFLFSTVGLDQCRWHYSPGTSWLSGLLYTVSCMNTCKGMILLSTCLKKLGSFLKLSPCFAMIF